MNLEIAVKKILLNELKENNFEIQGLDTFKMFVWYGCILYYIHKR